MSRKQYAGGGTDEYFARMLETAIAKNDLGELSGSIASKEDCEKLTAPARANEESLLHSASASVRASYDDLFAAADSVSGTRKEHPGLDCGESDSGKERLLSCCYLVSRLLPAGASRWIDNRSRREPLVVLEEDVDGGHAGG